LFRYLKMNPALNIASHSGYKPAAPVTKTRRDIHPVPLSKMNPALNMSSHSGYKPAAPVTKTRRDIHPVPLSKMNPCQIKRLDYTAIGDKGRNFLFTRQPFHRGPPNRHSGLVHNPLWRSTGDKIRYLNKATLSFPRKYLIVFCSLKTTAV
ncbi:MAG: hypothetical protein OEZ28_09625, partial [Nitrospinota bacterium]|nr:hypothetical protein [Nitrospinota bacterium]